MPRRQTPQELCLAIGERVKAFRLAFGLTQEEVAVTEDERETAFTRKGLISSVEHGLGNPTVETLQRIVEGLDAAGDVELCDLFITPDKGARHAVIALTRTLPEAALREILEKYGPAPELVPQKRKRARHRASGAKGKAR